MKGDIVSARRIRRFPYADLFVNGHAGWSSSPESFMFQGLSNLIVPVELVLVIPVLVIAWSA